MAITQEQNRDEEVHLEEHGSYALLRLAPPGSKVPVLTAARMDSLEKALALVAVKQPAVKALIITGPGNSGFCAGADISVIDGVRDSNQGRALAERGQRIFAMLEKLNCQTVAAISGPCVGGGCELALACNYRVLLQSEDTRIGLPEIKLGILPGFGGTQRLPRLIGLPAALDIILKGKLVTAKEALQLGLANNVINPEASDDERIRAFEAGVVELCMSAKLRASGMSLRDRFLTYTGIGRRLVERQVSPAIEKEGRGFYPAPKEALRACLLGLADGTERGYPAEAQALGELVATAVCKSLVHIFRITELANKLGKAANDEMKSARLLVVGGGVMGAGIAASFVSRGHDTTIVDAIPEAINAAEKRVQNFIQSRRGISDEKKAELLSRFHSIAGTVSGGDFHVVIEAIIEDLAAKNQLFKDFDGRLPESALLLSNTSSLAVSSLSEGLKYPKRVLGMHFFNPVEKMPLVEIVRTSKSDERSMLKVAALTTRLGKYPIIVEDVPGFLVNRILTPYLAEAGKLLSEGYSLSAIDKAALDFGMPMGPFRLLDEIGLDVAAKVQEILANAYGERMSGPAYAAALLKAGRKGKKSGAGFYAFDGEKAVPDETLTDILGMKGDKSPEKGRLAERLILAMLNEAVLSLDEGVSGQVGKDAAGQIDLGSVMGLGFPAFRGGILWYAQSRGLNDVAKSFAEIQSLSPTRLTACAGIVTRAKNRKSLYEGLN